MRAPLLLSLAALASCVSAPVGAGMPDDGLVDPGFGSAGLARLYPGDAGFDIHSSARDLAWSPLSGKFYVLGGSEELLLARLNGNGSLDTGFSIQGYASQLPDLPNGYRYTLKQIAISSSGKPLVAGTFTETESGFFDEQAVVCRLAVAGNADSSFDTDGCRVFEFDQGSSNSADEITAIWPLPGDELLIAGFASTEFPAQRAFIAKLQSNGSYDPDFGLGGLRWLNFPLTDAVHVGAIAVGADGRIFVSGGRSGSGIPTAYLAAFDAGGDPISAFGTNGMAQFSFANDFPPQSTVNHRISGLVTDPDGRITMCGNASGTNSVENLVALVRYNSDGELDPTFDGDGHVLTGFSELDSVNLTGPCVRDSRGRVTVALHHGNWTVYDPQLALMRFREDGSTDEYFDGDGRLSLALDIGPGDEGSEFVAGLVGQGQDLVVLATALEQDAGVNDGTSANQFIALRIRNDQAFQDGFEAAD